MTPTTHNFFFIYGSRCISFEQHCSREKMFYDEIYLGKVGYTILPWRFIMHLGILEVLRSPASKNNNNKLKILVNPTFPKHTVLTFSGTSYRRLELADSSLGKVLYFTILHFTNKKTKGQSLSNYIIQNCTNISLGKV